MQSPSALLPTFHTSLQSFASSPSTFLVLHTIPTSTPPSSTSSQIKTVHVLDSSFNPPTRAHLRIALSALQSTKNASKPQRLLLLLATQNADKAPKPAAFEQRLAMMTILAQDILDQYHSDATSQGSTAENGMDEDSLLAVDIGVTKYPYFHDKAISIDDSKYYAGPATGQLPQQVHLLGFDSLIRLLDTKYYPSTHTLDPLSALFSKHRIRVTRRTEDGDKYGTAEEQDRIWEALARGERESEGGKREWAERIEMVEGEGEAVSSTKVREGVGKGDWALVERLVGKGVREHVQGEGLYVADDKGG
ncbi:MAG: hypothetical protein LQ349_004808 [Xanthoria aureola]|nr:MAG: hypothetical protein LQ349_004808 [Xanthoria aureola]